MTKKELQEIMNRNMITSVEIDDAIMFVYELLVSQTEETEKRYPYATRTISEFENAAHIVWELQDYIGELDDDK